MKKTISLLLTLSLGFTTACYGYGPDTLRPQAFKVALPEVPSIEPYWFGEYKPIDDSYAVEEYLHINLPYALAEYIYSNEEAYKIFEEEDELRIAEVIEAILDKAQEEFRFQLADIPEADPEEALAYFDFYKKRAREDLLRKGAIRVNPEFNDFKMLAMTLAEDGVKFIMIDDYFNSRWIYPKGCFSKGKKAFPIHLSLEPYWSLVRPTDENSRIDKTGAMYLSGFEPMIAVRERITSPDFVLAKAARALEEEAEAETNVEHEATVKDVKQDLLYMFEDICYKQKRRPKAWLDEIKSKIITEREKGRTVIAEAAIELYEQIGGEVGEDSFTIMGSILVPVKSIAHIIKSVTAEQAPDDLFFNTLSSLVKWIKLYNLDSKRGSGMTRRDFLGVSGGAAISLSPAGRLIAFSKTMAIAREVLLKKYHPAPIQRIDNQEPIVYALLTGKKVPSIGYYGWAYGQDGYDRVKVLDITDENRIDAAYRLAFSNDILARVFGYTGNKPFDNNPDSAFKENIDILSRLRREAIDKHLPEGMKRNIILRATEITESLHSVNTRRDNISLKIKNIVFNETGMDVTNAVDNLETPDRFFVKIRKQLLNDSRIGEDTTLAEIEKIRKEYVKYYEGYIRKTFMGKIEDICKNYIEIVKRKLKKGDWVLDNAYPNPNRIDAHPDFAYLSVLKLFYYNLLTRGPEKVREFFDTHYPIYKKIGLRNLEHQMKVILAKEEIRERYGDEFLDEVANYKVGSWGDVSKKHKASGVRIPSTVYIFLEAGNDLRDYYGDFDKATFFNSHLLLDVLTEDDEIRYMGELAALLLGLPKFYDLFIEGLLAHDIDGKFIKERIRDSEHEAISPEPLIKWLLEPLPEYFRAAVILGKGSLQDRFKSAVLNRNRIAYYDIPRIEYVPEDGESAGRPDNAEDAVSKPSSAGEEINRREFLKGVAAGATSLLGIGDGQILAGPAVSDMPLAFNGMVYQEFESSDHGCWALDSADNIRLSVRGEPLHSSGHSLKLSTAITDKGTKELQTRTGIGIKFQGATPWHVDFHPEKYDRLTFWVYSEHLNGLDNNLYIQFFDQGYHKSNPVEVWTKEAARYRKWTRMAVLFKDLPETLNLYDIDKIQVGFWWEGTHYIDDIRITGPLPEIDTAELSNGVVKWASLAGAVSYRLERSEQGSDGPWEIIYEGTDTSFVMSDLRRTWYRVAAVDESGMAHISDYSDVAEYVPFPAFIKTQDSILKTEGTLIKDEYGDTVRLRGVNLGGLFVNEPWLTGIGESDDPVIEDDWTLREILSERFGAEGTRELLEVYQQSYIGTQDFDNLVDLGINCVRLPLNYQLLQDEFGNWITDNRGRIDFSAIDRIVDACADRGIYVLLDMHAAPGAQSNKFHSGRKNFNKLFEESREGQLYRRRTIEIWQAIAEHYKDSAAVCGYDLLNEPTGASSKKALFGLYDSLYRAIRAIDDKHIIVMEGTWINEKNLYDWDTLPVPDDVGWENVAYHFHYYNFDHYGYEDTAHHKAFIDEKMAEIARKQLEYNVPVGIGEFSAFNVRENWDNYINVFDDQGLGWMLWSLKSRYSPSNWGLYNWIGDEEDLPRIRTDSFDELMRKFKAFSTAESFVPNYSLTGIVKKHLVPEASQKSSSSGNSKIDKIRKDLQSSSAEIRMDAAASISFTLANERDPVLFRSLFEVLLYSLGDSDLGVRSVAFGALSSSTSYLERAPDIRELIMPIVIDVFKKKPSDILRSKEDRYREDAYIPYEAARTLWKLLDQMYDEKIVETLFLAYKHKKGRVRQMAIRALIKQGSTRVKNLLINALDDQDMDVCVTSAFALFYTHKFSNERSVDIIIEALENKGYFFNIGDVDWILGKEYADKHRVSSELTLTICKVAAKTLGLVDDTRAEIVLTDIFREQTVKEPLQRNHSLYEGVIEALDQIHDRKEEERIIREMAAGERGKCPEAAKRLGLNEDEYKRLLYLLRYFKDEFIIESPEEVVTLLIILSSEDEERLSLTVSEKIVVRRLLNKYKRNSQVNNFQAIFLLANKINQALEVAIDPAKEIFESLQPGLYDQLAFQEMATRGNLLIDIDESKLFLLQPFPKKRVKASRVLGKKIISVAISAAA